MTALVTGAGSGIGRAIAKKLAELGFHVAVVDLNLKSARETAAKIVADGGQALAFQCDVGRPTAVDRTFKRVVRVLGEVEVLVNNAGVGGPFHRIDEVSLKEWDWIMNTNLKSVFLFSRLALPRMRRRGRGRVINIASIQGLLGSERSSTYVASKHAMIGYTRAIATEWGPSGITCNAVCPGYVDTRMGAQKKFAELPAIKRRTPVKRIAHPEEVADLVAWIAGPHSGYLNGAILTLDGGISASLGLN